MQDLTPLGGGGGNVGSSECHLEAWENATHDKTCEDTKAAEVAEEERNKKAQNGWAGVIL